MSEHYFTAQPTSAHQEAEFTAMLRGQPLRFITDRGVFSRHRVDFGSELLIETVVMAPDDVVLDLGCGYGAVGCAVAGLVSRGRVYMVDINARAAGLARRNLAANGITNAEVRVGDGAQPVSELRFQHVLLNPPVRAGKRAVYDLIGQAHDRLLGGGSLWVVIQTKQGAPSMKTFLQEHFAAVTDVARDGGYRILKAVK